MPAEACAPLLVTLTRTVVGMPPWLMAVVLSATARLCDESAWWATALAPAHERSGEARTGTASAEAQQVGRKRVRTDASDDTWTVNHLNADQTRE